jgi:hypothetical protein
VQRSRLCCTCGCGFRRMWRRAATSSVCLWRVQQAAAKETCILDEAHNVTEHALLVEAAEANIALPPLTQHRARHALPLDCAHMHHAYTQPRQPSLGTYVIGMHRPPLTIGTCINLCTHTPPSTRKVSHTDMQAKGITIGIAADTSIATQASPGS